MFKKGDLAVYPGYGVGKIVGIEERIVSGEKKTFYVLEILKKGMKVMVPKQNAKDRGLRDIVNQRRASRVFTILKKRDIHLNNQNWTKRFKEYQDKIKTGSLFEIAEVVRDIHLLGMKKNLSFGERKIFENAKGLLVHELSIAYGKAEEEIKNKIDKCLSQ